MSRSSCDKPSSRARPLAPEAHAERTAAFAVARACFDEEELIDLVTVISCFGWFNRWNSLLRSELETEPAAVVAQLPWLSPLLDAPT